MTRLNRTTIAFTLLGTAALWTAGCTKKKDVLPSFDADLNSGADKIRNGAQRISVNTVSADDVSFEKQDQTDWKQVELKGKPGILQAELRWDNVNADLNIAIFNSFGEEMAASPGPAPGLQKKEVAIEVTQLGVYYLRIQAAKKSDFSVYNVTARWGGGGEEPVATAQPLVDNSVTPPPPPPELNETKKPRHKSSGEPKPAPKPKAKNYDNGVQGRVVSSYREGGTLTLHIDKGSAAGVKVGSSGALLDGPSGSNPLEGGTFTITQVIDEGKSVAKTNLKSLGRNTRVSILTGK